MLSLDVYVEHKDILVGQGVHLSDKGTIVGQGDILSDKGTLSPLDLVEILVSSISYSCEILSGFVEGWFSVALWHVLCTIWAPKLIKLATIREPPAIKKEMSCFMGFYYPAY